MKTAIELTMEKFEKYDNKYKNRIINFYNHIRRFSEPNITLNKKSKNLVLKMYHKGIIEIEFHKNFISIFMEREYFDRINTFYEEVNNFDSYHYLFNIIESLYDNNDHYYEGF